MGSVQLFLFLTNRDFQIGELRRVTTSWQNKYKARFATGYDLACVAVFSFSFQASGSRVTRGLGDRGDKQLVAVGRALAFSH